MKAVNLIVMGKTGAGKSTLINAVLGKDLAPIGTGGAVTKKIQVYSRKKLIHFPVSGSENASGSYRIAFRTVNLYDTVGLEIDSAITKKTLKDIRETLHRAKQTDNEQDITMVWFCISANSSRFEKYEAELIKDLSTEYEIPFVIVLTKCFSDEQGELERQIGQELSEITTIRVLAKNYRTRGGTIPAFGMNDLMCRSIAEYSEKRVHILQAKLDKLLNSRAEMLGQNGNAIIGKYQKKASRIGLLPVAGIPFVHGLCHKMICELNSLYGIKASEEYLTNVIAGIIITPFMAIPLLSSAAAESYVQTIGTEYLKALTVADNESFDMGTDIDISRVYEELQKQQKKERHKHE